VVINRQIKGCRKEWSEAIISLFVIDLQCIPHIIMTELENELHQDFNNTMESFLNDRAIDGLKIPLLRGVNHAVHLLIEHEPSRRWFFDF
jgi:hypothetical protein